MEAIRSSRDPDDLLRSLKPVYGQMSADKRVNTG
jgi:hypothetical protein